MGDPLDYESQTTQTRNSGCASVLAGGAAGFVIGAVVAVVGRKIIRALLPFPDYLAYDEMLLLVTPSGSIVGGVVAGYVTRGR